MTMINNIHNINPNNKPFVSFKKSEDNKTQENKKVPSTTEIVLGATAVAALGVATFALISSHKNKKAYEKILDERILDEKISKKLDEKSSEIIDNKVVKTLNEKSTKIIDSKVTQKVNETTDKILDDKIKKIVEDKASEIVENKFNKDFDNKFPGTLKLCLKNAYEEIHNSPQCKELMKELELIINGIEAWKQEVDRKLGLIDKLSFFDGFSFMNPKRMSMQDVIKMYFPNYFI